MNEYRWPRPLTIWSRFVNIDSNSIFKISMNTESAELAIKEINKVSDFAKPLDPVINRWLYDDDYVKTVLLSGNVKAFRDMILNNNINSYLRDLYKLQITEKSKLDDKQREGLKNLDLKFTSGKPYEQNELTYINNIIDMYIDDVLPIIKKHPQYVDVIYKDWWTEKISLNYSIMLINE